MSIGQKKSCHFLYSYDNLNAAAGTSTCGVLENSISMLWVISAPRRGTDVVGSEYFFFSSQNCCNEWTFFLPFFLYFCGVISAYSVFSSSTVTLDRLPGKMSFGIWNLELNITWFYVFQLTCGENHFPCLLVTDGLHYLYLSLQR